MGRFNTSKIIDRNGYSKKTVLTQDQEIELNVPRDRNSEFEPEIVPKYSKKLHLFNDQIISLYSYIH